MTKSLVWTGRFGLVAIAVLATACGASSGGGTGGAGTSGASGTTGAAGTPATGGTTGAAGTPATGGTTGAAGTGGTTGAAGTPATGGTTGAAGTPATGGTTGTGGTPATGGTTGTGGTPGTGGTTAAQMSAGCNMSPAGTDSSTAFIKKDIMVTGVDPAFITAHPPNANDTYSWTKRNYYIRLPAGYDPSKAYAIDMAGTGCGGDDTVGSTGDYTIPPTTGQNMAFQVGMSYVPSNSINTCGTFADGYTNSPEPEYMNAIIDDISSKYCVNTSKIFVNGYSSGAWMAALSGCTNQDKVRAFGVQVGGGLRTRPTCMNKPVAAMFVVGTADTGNPIGPLATPLNGSTGSFGLRDELLKRNGCVTADFQIVDTCPATASANGTPCAAGVSIGDTYSNVPNTMWNATYPKCHMYTGCPAKYPVVWCPLDVNHGNGPNPMGTDGGAILEGYRRQGMWDFFNSLPAE